MVTDGKHLFDDREFCGRNVLVVDKSEEKSFVRGNIASLHGGLAPRNVTEPSTNLSMLALERSKESIIAILLSLRTRECLRLIIITHKSTHFVTVKNPKTS